MKKQGFTLIELMVVIVIMGILAAVAVPKLFGMIAKSKASELGPAAGTYVKLQQAYFSEKNMYGGWSVIGYSAPGGSSGVSSSTNNFDYDGSAIGATDETNAQTNAVWKAQNKVKLNDCASAWNWQINVAASGAGVMDSYTAVVNSKATCLQLAPNFEQIGK